MTNGQDAPPPPPGQYPAQQAPGQAPAPPPGQPVPGGPPPAYAGAQGPSGPRANFGQRLVGAIIDGLILGVIGYVLGLIFQSTVVGWINFVIGIAYYVYLEASPSGQTLGKRAMSIRVIAFDTGGQLDYGRAAIRYFARILSTIPCLLGYFWMLWDKERQTWHDKLSTSVVVPVQAYPVDKWPG